MQRLFGAEAERVLAVLDNTTDALQVLSVVPATPKPDVTDTLEERGAARAAERLRDLWRLEEGKVRHCGG